ncbi:MAG TPA: hypothetical protein DCL61_21200 [Cyanobacteria bacterium UBA12227]|nr:hypothetical protein [Cyanobacteria bacterium UBA12227]HAX89845.1 hypothetical protein [Cyanobacteria bacterium UBA11370]HBY80034.1 hypothetical protein [Cyanobacteria bacterium UBA11148]
MKKATKFTFICLLIATTSSVPVAAQTEQPEIIPSSSSETPTDLKITPRIGVGYTTSGGGFEGFTRLEGFFPLYQRPGNDLLFLEGRLLLDNDSNLGGNLLVGYRNYDANSNRIVGGYFSYDRRDTDDNAFNQIGIGFETLGNWDARINAYFPTGEIRQVAGENISDGFRFQNHFLLLDRVRQFESAATVFDTELGGKLVSVGEGSLRGYGGLYYITAQGGDTAVGVRGRLEFLPTDYITLNLAVQSDRIFDTRVIASLGITFPGSSPRGNGEIPEALSRIGESVNRQWAITVIEKSEQDQILALNPATKQPWRFQHILLEDNTNTTGNGTFESPFNLVQNGLDQTRSDGNDIVYVQKGTNPGIPPFLIPDQVQVLSTGPIQEIDTVQLGRVQLPLSGSEMLPTIIPGAAASVTMGNRTTLSGFEIINAGTNGIEGKDIDTVTIRDNEITNSTQHGISLLNTTGEVTITNNIIDKTEGFPGLFLGNSVGAVDLKIINNEIINTNNNGIGINLSETAQGLATISDNTIAENLGNGIFMSLGGKVRAMLNLSDNTISRNQLNGVLIGAGENSRSTATISSNTISENQSSGIFMALEGTAQGTTNITDNTISENQSAGVFVGLLEESEGTVNINNSTISQNQLTGISVFQQGESQGTIDISNNTISENNSDGIAIGLFEAAQGEFSIQDNDTISDNKGSGIAVGLLGSTQGEFTIKNNGTISNNNANGITVEMLEDSISNFTVENNTISENQFNGVFLGLTGQSQGTLNIANSTISENQSNGVFVRSLETSQSVVNISNSTISENIADGIFLLLQGESRGLTNISDSTISRSGSRGIRAIVTGDSTTDLTIDDNTIAENGNSGIGINFLIQNPQTSTTSITNNIISNNGSDGIAMSDSEGIAIKTSGDTILELLIQGNVSTNNARFGIFVIADEESQLRAGVRFNTLEDNPGSSNPPLPNGFSAQTGSSLNDNSTSTLCLDLSNNDSDNGFLFNNLSPQSTFKVSTEENEGTIEESGATTLRDEQDCPVP